MGLLDLPVEVLELVVRWVALLRYDYSESRRPKPSALHHLAYGTNGLLRRIALPYLFREAWTASDAWADKVWLPGEGLVEPTRFVRVLRHSLHGNVASEPTPLELAPQVERVVLAWSADRTFAYAPPMRPDQASHVKSIELRHAGLPVLTLKDMYFSNFANLVSVKLHNSTSLVLPVFYHISSITEFAFSVEHRAVIDTDAPLWRQLRRLEIVVLPPSSRQRDANALAGFLQTFKFPTANSNLRFLSLATQLDTVFTGEARPMHPIVQAIKASFGSIPLTSLSIDDHTTCTPQDLADLAAAFPTLKTLSLPDRTVWDGSRADLLAALSPLIGLETLSCRLPPDTPASLFDPPASPSSSSGDDALFASPAAIALEAASHLPRLGLVGFVGQHSDMEWFRVRRNEEGRPEEAEGVRLVEMDLDRP
ncbi:hypothetical protein JCM10449v2_000641 [Rhodotorula kratochvilovae]